MKCLMKRFMLIVCWLLVFSNLVYAGESLKINLGEEENTLVALGEKDRVEFLMMGGRHTIVADKIHDKGVDLDIFLFVDTNISRNIICNNIYFTKCVN